MDTCILHLSTLCCLLLTVAGCKVKDWRHMTFEELLSGADIVVTGNDMTHIVTGNGSSREDSEFRVDCILKGDNQDIEETIRIEDVNSGTTCWDPDMRAGETYIVGLKRTPTGYIEHHVNVQQEAAFPKTSENIWRALRICGLQDTRLPKGMEESQRPEFCQKPNPTDECFSGQGESAYLTNTVMLGTLTLSFILTYFIQVL